MKEKQGNAMEAMLCVHGGYMFLYGSGFRD